jgi:lipopolysaccharide transport system ATP-binding protein
LSQPIIEVKNLSKAYKLGTIGATSLRDEVGRWWSRLPWSKERRAKSEEQRASAHSGSPLALSALPLALSSSPLAPCSSDGKFWALRDVSFNVERGEVLGIIGRNGAGKSTLLKILSRITEPTCGEVILRGRVASLLEVGTGFHPELSGRENIFLNGAILGMSRAEIKRKFDEIVAFAEVEQFIDTPVKRYSSGMYVRLAFAVAAHLEPEILMIDEVLAVGDAAFQKKCLGKMGEVARAGRTVLFVSHQMAVVRNLCERVVLLGEGRVVMEGTSGEVLARYLAEARDFGGTALLERRDREGSGLMRFVSVEVRTDGHESRSAISSGQGGRLLLGFANQSGRVLKNVTVAVGVDDVFGQRLLVFSNELTNEIAASVPTGSGMMEFQFEALPLSPGRYDLTFFASAEGQVMDWIQRAAVLEVEAGDFFGTGRLPPVGQGNLLVRHHFSLKEGCINPAASPGRS